MNMSNALLDNQSITIGQGVTFKGSLNVPSKAVINGTVDGDLTADELEMGPTGKITGLITARKIDVQGELHQVITCKDHLMIRSTGKVSGAIEYSEIEIERGGQFRGEMKQVGIKTFG
jgi:cytoskeletal protein CcmA (bactofilin family)